MVLQERPRRRAAFSFLWGMYSTKFTDAIYMKKGTDDDMSELRQIAILGFRRKLRDEVEQSISDCLEDAGITLQKYHLDEPVYNPVPPGIIAAFVIVDSASAAGALRSVSGWSENLPVVVVSNHPQYALEGIRTQVRHYILFPLTNKDMREALTRVGIEVKPLDKNIVI
jgi:hypothetical protein